MPNWCLTSYKLVGDTDEIAELYTKLKELEDMPEPLVENNFGNLFLGCIINHLEGDYNDVDCRGAVDYMELCGEEMIQLSTISAWGNKTEVWDFVCQKYPSISYYYLSEDGETGHYINSDSTGEYFPEKYVIFDFVNGQEYANDDEGLFEEMAKRLDVESIKDFSQLCTLLDKRNEDNPENRMYYNEFKSPTY